MAQPTHTDQHVNAVLTNMSVAWFQEMSRFQASAAAADVPVMKQSDIYYQYDMDVFFRDNMARRAPATESQGTGYTTVTKDYRCDVWALHHDIPDENRANTDSPLSPDADGTQLLTQSACIRLERDWLDTYWKTGVWGTDGTVSNKWDTSGSDPVQDIDNASIKIEETTGRTPNVLIITRKVWNALKHNASIIDRYKQTTPAAMTTQLVAQLCDIDQILVCRAVYDSQGTEGLDASMGFMTGDDGALLIYRNPSAGLRQPSAAYRFVWTSLADTSVPPSGMAPSISSFRMPLKRSDRLEIQMSWVHKVICPEMGYFIADTIG